MARRARDGRRGSVREGERSRRRWPRSGVFPDVAVKMVEVGEATGALQEMLNSLADFYDEEIETDLGRFVTLVEPVLLVMMGIVIAGLLLALYMPLFQLTSARGASAAGDGRAERTADRERPTAARPLPTRRRRCEPAQATERARGRGTGAGAAAGGALPARVRRPRAVPASTTSCSARFRPT